ncbi:MAG: hypothetical protein AAGU27_10750 [Dehalobacterium sp.]
MKSIQFFKGKMNKHFTSSKEAEEPFAVHVIEESNDESETATSNEPFSLNDSDDELSANLMSSVFAIIEERRKMSLMITELKEKVFDSNQIISSILEEKNQLTNSLTEREKQLKVLQSKSEDQQERYEELLEDHKLLRINELEERKRLQQQIKELKSDYETVSNEFRQFQSDTGKEIMGYKDALREEKEKYNHLLLKYNKLSEDNSTLLEKISIFTKQISSVQILSTLLSTDNEKTGTNNS